jgi:hypothetical protein
MRVRVSNDELVPLCGTFSATVGEANPDLGEIAAAGTPATA